LEIDLQRFIYEKSFATFYLRDAIFLIFVRYLHNLLADKASEK